MNGWDDEYESQWRRRPATKYVIMLVLFVVLLAAALFVLVGCERVTREDRLHNSVVGYTAEILNGEPNKAYDRLSARCQERMGRHFYTEAWVSVRRDWTGSPGIRSYSASIDGNRAEVTYRFENPVWDQEKEAWIWEDGKWVNDEC